jgi:hypothetical protein
MRALSALLLILLPLSIPAMAEPDPERPAPERVYRQLRAEPAVRTREGALQFLADASPDGLWRSSKLAVDERIQHLLAQAGFESLDEPVQSKLHTQMLEIRSSFWAADLEKLSSAGRALRELWESGSIVSTAADRESAERIQPRLLDLVEEVETAVALQRCARTEHDLGTAAYLDCVLGAAPGG